MIYLIFTQAGFEQAKQTILEQKSALWLNPGILSEAQLTELESTGITVNILDAVVDPTNEKAIFAVIDTIEASVPSAELFVEYL